MDRAMTVYRPVSRLLCVLDRVRRPAGAER
jgi:hypothetical protein